MIKVYTMMYLLQNKESPFVLYLDNQYALYVYLIIKSRNVTEGQTVELKEAIWGLNETIHIHYMQFYYTFVPPGSATQSSITFYFFLFHAFNCIHNWQHVCNKSKHTNWRAPKNERLSNRMQRHDQTLNILESPRKKRPIIINKNPGR